MLENMITDRTAEDVLRWRELRDKGIDKMTSEEFAEWESNMKGSYNISDLNRVGSVLAFLRNELIKAGYLTGIEFDPKTDWTESDVPTRQDYYQYIYAVHTVRNALAQYNTTPKAPNVLGKLGFEDANDIEKILIDIDDILIKTNANPLVCGELYCGEI